jgi:hypothetical protein
MNKMVKRTIRKSLIISLFAIILITFGCSKVNQDNYDKLSLGMDYEEVIKILGQPSECKSILNTKSCTWGSSSKKIALKLVADKVVFLSSQGLK